MSRRHWCLLMDSSTWRVMDLTDKGLVTEVGLAGSESPTDAAWTVFQDLGYDGGDVLLALPSVICLTGQIPISRLPPRADDQTKLFLLEDLLPVAAEEVTADFLSSPSRILGVAVVTEPLRQTIEQLENLGLSIHSIVPWSLLAAHDWIHQRGEADVLVASRPSGVEIIEMAEGRICGWSVADSEKELQWRLAALAADVGRALAVVSDASPPTGDSNRWIASASSWDAAALATAGQVMSGSMSPLIELRRDRLEGAATSRALRGYVRMFQFTTALLLLTMLAGVLWQAARYSRMADDYVSRQQRLFQQILPGQPIPAGIRSRLESERARLRTQQESAAKIPGRDSALLTLVQFLRGVPTSIRIKVNGLAVAGHQVNVRSEVRTPGDASTFVQALRDAGFQVKIPRSVRSGESYAVDFDAQLNPVLRTGADLP
ncbi:GspL periplasmic domain protein [Caulifigura coniformis]|uniref:GspL periplasmic domain protein n=1 Tax=Caulifigura coniformis TaxID=2527983 RepID=A0A517SMB5_9PLAN|nr:GspL/Epsl periplasmic domain-containing protein [Caulifigura coniformis]QDT57269.1 GspL periplasmic domain protein [Caulifigura coniformis]